MTIMAIAMIFQIVGCGKDHKTPADIKKTVAWLDGKWALPVFPFGTNPIYMYVNSAKDKFCKRMNRDIFARPEIIKYLNEHFTSISVNPDSLGEVEFYGEKYNGEKFKQAFKIENYPVHIFFNLQGEVKGLRDGYINQEEFKQLIRYIAEGYIEKFDFETFLNMPESKVDTSWGEF